MNSVDWRKSTYSGGEGGQCVEVGQATGIIVRDAKNNSTGPVLQFSPTDWARFTHTLL